MKKRLFNIVLSICMVLALMPAAAYAETTIERGTTITEGTFTDVVENEGTINGGIFNGTVYNANGIISGGTFEGQVTNVAGGHISGGTFNGAVNNYDGFIIGGTFNQTVYSENIDMIKGGVFYRGISGNGDIGSMYCSVTFKNEGSDYAVEIVKNGSKATVPDEPTKDGYKFTGWYTDEELTRLYDFDTPVKANELILYAGWKVTVPFITTIKQDGNVAPGEATFNLQIVNRKGDKITSEDVEIKGTSVTTNGKGSYEGEITFTGTQREILELFDNNSGTVFVKQEDVDDSDWDVDDTVWCLYYPLAVELNEDEAETSPILILPTICEYDGDDMYYNPDFPDDNENPMNKMTFINTYTKSVSDPSDPEGTTNGDSDNDSKADAENSAKTGDNTNLALWIALMILAGAGIAGTTIYTRRKRTNE